MQFLLKLFKLHKLVSKFTRLFFILVLLLATTEVKAQQGGTVTYGYDANGRLISVTLPTGESVTYSYDPAGNITSIQRNNGSGPQFLSFSPQSGFVDDTVTFSGTNFGSVTSVSFNGTLASVFSGNMNQITVKVPANAGTGAITVTLSNGTFTTSAFTVLSLQITPSQAAVLPTQTQQFTALVPPQLSNTSVTWSVNGVNGGNSSLGTISSSGLYTAPSISNTQNFTVRATSVARPAVFAQGTIKVSSNLFQASSSLSVQYKEELRASQVSAPPVSISNAPSISTISPNTFTRNSTNTITITGSSLFGTTALVLLNSDNGFVANGVSVSNITVASDGNSLTATITVSSSAQTGTKVVVVSGATTGHSTTSNLSNNTISITP